jgi:hypothetical protein|tara:strand:+ start:2883 stop:3236 length:354 start_codon:yes stop_codon:yes gene_type:complete
MADREIKYAFTVLDNSDALVTFSDVNDAKSKITWNNFNHDLGTQNWTLEDSNRRLVLTWVFTESQADDQLTVHNAIKNGDWEVTPTGHNANGTGELKGSVERVASSEHYKVWNKNQS